MTKLESELDKISDSYDGAIEDRYAGSAEATPYELDEISMGIYI